MLGKVLWLIERREAMPLMAGENPEAKPQSDNLVTVAPQCSNRNSELSQVAL
jgi:hypothetical protein